MKTEPNKPQPPRSGIYGNPDVVKAYNALYDGVHEFMNDNEDCSSGNLSIKGTGSMAKARAKNLTMLAKNLENIISASTYGRY